MYRLAHWLKDKIPFLWSFIEFLNMLLFRVKYGKKVLSIDDILYKYQGKYLIREATLNDLEVILTFFSEQPQETFKYFSPHKFDLETVSRLINNDAYLFFIVMNDKQMVGYFFLRCFFMENVLEEKLLIIDGVIVALQN